MMKELQRKVKAPGRFRRGGIGMEIRNRNNTAAPGTIDFFKETGFCPESLNAFLDKVLSDQQNSIEQIGTLKKLRFYLLDEIHDKQQLLDRLDYTIYRIKSGKAGA